MFVPVLTSYCSAPAAPGLCVEHLRAVTIVRCLFRLRQARKTGLWTMITFVSGFAFMRGLKTANYGFGAPWAQILIFAVGGYAVFMAVRESTMMLSACARKAANRIAQAVVFASVAYLVLLLVLRAPLPELSPSGSMRPELILVYSWLLAAWPRPVGPGGSSTTLSPPATITELVWNVIQEYSGAVIAMTGTNNACQRRLWTLLAGAGGLSLLLWGSDASASCWTMWMWVPLFAITMYAAWRAARDTMLTLSARARRVGYTAVKVMLAIIVLYMLMLIMAPFGIEPPGRGPNGLVLMEVHLMRALLISIMAGIAEAHRIRRPPGGSDKPGDGR